MFRRRKTGEHARAHSTTSAVPSPVTADNDIWYKKPTTTPPNNNSNMNTDIYTQAAASSITRNDSNNSGGSRRTRRSSTSDASPPLPRQRQPTLTNSSNANNNRRSSLDNVFSSTASAAWENPNSNSNPSLQQQQYNRAAPNNSAGAAGRDRDQSPMSQDLNNYRGVAAAGQGHARMLNPPSKSGEFSQAHHPHNHGNPGNPSRSHQEQDHMMNTGRRPMPGIQHTGRAVTSGPAGAQNNNNNQRPNRTYRSTICVQDVLRNQAVDFPDTVAPPPSQPSRQRPRHPSMDGPITTSNSPPLSEPWQQNHNHHAPPPPTPTLVTTPPKINGFARHMQTQMEAHHQKAEEAHQHEQTNTNPIYRAQKPSAAETVEQSNQHEGMMGHQLLLVLGMNSNVQSLHDMLQSKRMDLEQKLSQITELDQQMGQMNHARQTLDLEFETAQLSLVQQHELLSHKTECVSDLQYQIAQMQSELRREQTEMEQLQGSLLRNQTSVNHSELELRAAADEHDTMGAIRQALEDEKDMLYRDVSNCESELKSLEAIQNLARDDEF